jgi:outer membrane protein assembly factor BamB
MTPDPEWCAMRMAKWKMASGSRRFAALLVGGTILLASPASGADWPTFRADARRSGVTSEALPPRLESIWVHRPLHAPRPAWPGPARQDHWHELHELAPTLTYDRVFHVALADGALFFGSSADDSVHCLDAVTGERRWHFTTEGPVRLAPTVAGGKVYFGSDDGFLYCLDAFDGSLRWKRRGGPEDRRLPGNGRMISLWPLRSGALVEEGKVYFTAGLFPDRGVTLHAVDAGSGEAIWESEASLTAQGYLLASPTRLFVPAGRTSPHAFDRRTGASLGSIDGVGGSFALVLEDMLVQGVSEKGELRISEPTTKERIVTARAQRMLADGPTAYFLRPGSLSALDRKRYLEVNREINAIQRVRAEERSAEQNESLAGLIEARSVCMRWDVACAASFEMILAGDAIVVGGNGEVVVHDAEDGALRWRGSVDGRAHGLAVSEGRLYVSTDSGAIHCFAAEGAVRPEPSGQVDGHVIRKLEAPRVRELVGSILEESGTRQGYALIVGATDGRIAREIARNSELRVVGAMRDPEGIEIARRGLPDPRVSFHHVSTAALPYQSLFANLIICDATSSPGGVPGYSAGEILRVLRPSGGTLLVLGPDPGALEEWGSGVLDGWRVTFDASHPDEPARGILHRSALEGAGEWTHLYAEPGNSASSGDRLTRGDMDLQWFGRPGPREMVDRHHRNVPPLYKDGRCFIPGDRIVYAADAYNGTILWSARLPASRRLGVFLDSTNLVVDEQHLWWAAADRCHGFDVATGEETRVHEVPELPRLGAGASEELVWGYLSCVGDTLFGSACRTDAAYREQSRAGDQALWYQGMKLVTSEALFALDRRDGDVRWTWRGGAVVNTTITLADGMIWFVETTSPRALADPVGQLPLAELFDGGEQTLVCLDATDGTERWRRPLDTEALTEVCYLATADGILLLSGSRRVEPTVEYHYFAFDAATGEPRWKANHLTGLPDDGGHGEYNRHPTIVEGTVYAWPYALELQTGERIEGWKFDRRGHGCGAISASAASLFWRGGNPWMLDLEEGAEALRLNSVSRPGCWINILPAGGLVLVPEASSGCTCAFPFQMSMAFHPAPPPPRIEPAGSLFVGHITPRLIDPRGGGTIRYTLDGGEPGRESPLFDPDAEIEGDAPVLHLRARTWWPDGTRSAIAERTFTRVEARPAERISAPVPGIGYTLRGGGSFARLADLARNPELARGVHSRFDLELGLSGELGLAARPEPFGVRFEGLIEVPRDGVYRFFTTSDDGSSLSIGGVTVVDNDGLHGRTTAEGTTALAAGFHPIEVLFFEAGGAEGLTVSWEGPDFARREISAEHLFHLP